MAPRAHGLASLPGAYDAHQLEQGGQRANWVVGRIMSNRVFLELNEAGVDPNHGSLAPICCLTPLLHRM